MKEADEKGLRVAESPVPTTVRKFERRGQMIEEVAARDFFRSEAHHMRRGLLAVDDAETPGMQLTHKKYQRNL